MFAKNQSIKRQYIGKNIENFMELPNLIDIQLASYEKFLQSEKVRKGEPLEEDDVTFADETPDSTDAGQPSMRLPDGKVEDAFSDIRLSDVPVEYENGEDEETGEYASGATIEEMNEAVRTADNPQATESEKLKAGEVLHEMEGNELYLVLTAGKPQIKNKIRGLIDNYKNKPTISSGGNNEVLSVSPQPIPVVEGLESFDIRDFV